MNILSKPGGMEELQRLGARSVPVVSQGNRFVFAQMIGDVVEFLGLDDDTAPKLSPDQLKKRYSHILDTAIHLIRSMPDEYLEKELPDRPRSWRVLMHHIFQIPTAFLDMEETRNVLSHESTVNPPPDGMTTSASIADFGQSVKERFDNWSQATRGEDFTVEVPTYFGQTTRHEIFERTVWHSTQHVRQVTVLLEQVGRTPSRALSSADIEGLPLPEQIWG